MDKTRDNGHKLKHRKFRLFWFGCVRQQKHHAVDTPLLGCEGEWKETGRNWWVWIRAV